jgi:acyl-CoA synthetase (AMP-forming)/AMP-acid ligase II
LTWLTTLPVILEDRARRTPDELAYRFWTSETRELSRQVEHCAGVLFAHGLGGERAVLHYESVRDLVIAVLACMRIGSVPVPVAPLRGPRDRERLAAVVADAEPAAVLSTRAAIERVGDEIRGGPLRWIATDDLGEATSAPAHRPGGAELALLQYTSGSTSRPKGVMVTYDNLWANAEAIRIRFGHTRQSRGVIWLPPHHDMGLMGGVLQPLFVGFPVLLMPTLSFITRPHRWLQLISDFGATTSGGPCFAYDLCAQKVSDDKLRGVDLSSWQIAFVGAEPVRSSVLRRFADRFAPYGFRAESLYPCYGLAEGTLMATGAAARRLPVVVSVDPAELAKGRAEPSQSAGRPFVSVGEAIPDHQVQIVDPDSRIPCASGEIGELWVSGPSVAAGYWRDEVTTRERVAASLATGGPNHWLRTGDLGFELDGELYVTGRIKSVIILNGRNYHAEDIEAVAEEAADGVTAGSVAALSWTADERERLVLVVEAAPDAGELASAMRESVRAALGIPIASVILVKKRHLPRTTSGKLRREMIREALEAGALEPTGIFSMPGLELAIGAARSVHA